MYLETSMEESYPIPLGITRVASVGLLAQMIGSSLIVVPGYQAVSLYSLYLQQLHACGNSINY